MQNIKNIKNIFRRSSQAKYGPAEVEQEVYEAISLCFLAGFKPSKVRWLIERIASFELVDCSQYATDRLEQYFLGKMNRRDKSHMQFLEHGATAVQMRQQARDTYREQTQAEGVWEPDTPGVMRVEEQNFLRRWTEQIRILNLYQRHQLELKFKTEIDSYIASLKPSTAAAVVDTDTVKVLKNLEAFQGGAEERREAIVSKGSTTTNNRQPVTHVSLRDGYKNSSMASSAEQFLTPTPKGWDGEGIGRPGSAQSLDPAGYFLPRQTN